ncbi:hypothetical protein E2C01_070173 [Portunus trituberculatus]|uniref:Uncharacterized protein n=1 Tax=Portunus trituberculatus TaxID=210409 RepID=A0A5B7I4E7_PORTR|nr:hypothetical protein [Portunus trituberculatus]
MFQQNIDVLWSSSEDPAVTTPSYVYVYAWRQERRPVDHVRCHSLRTRSNPAENMKQEDCENIKKSKECHFSPKIPNN